MIGPVSQNQTNVTIALESYAPIAQHVTRLPDQHSASNETHRQRTAHNPTFLETVLKARETFARQSIIGRKIQTSDTSLLHVMPYSRRVA